MNVNHEWSAYLPWVMLPRELTGKRRKKKQYFNVYFLTLREVRRCERAGEIRGDRFFNALFERRPTDFAGTAGMPVGASSGFADGTAGAPAAGTLGLLEGAAEGTELLEGTAGAGGATMGGVAPPAGSAGTVLLPVGGVETGGIAGAGDPAP